MPTHSRGTIAVIFAALLALMTVPGRAQNDEVVATVNGQPILGQRLTDELLQRWGELTLEALIQEMAIDQAAAQAGIEVTDKEVSKRIMDFQRSIDLKAPVTGQSFTLWLADQKLTLFGLTRQIRVQTILEKMVEGQVTVTDREVAEAWERNRERLRQPEKMHVAHICVKTQAEAERIRAEIVAGKDFAAAAKESSIDPWTKDQGGDFGWISRGSDPFQMAAFELQKDGDLSPVTETKMGWHVIRRLEHRPATTPSFEDIQDELREGMLRQRRLQKMNEKRREILAAATIEHKLDPDDLVSTAAGEGGE